MSVMKVVVSLIDSMREKRKVIDSLTGKSDGMNGENIQYILEVNAEEEERRRKKKVRSEM